MTIAKILFAEMCSLPQPFQIPVTFNITFRVVMSAGVATEKFGGMSGPTDALRTAQEIALKNVEDFIVTRYLEQV